MSERWFVSRICGFWLVYDTPMLMVQGMSSGLVHARRPIEQVDTKTLSSPTEMWIQTYVDDPDITVKGIKAGRDRLFVSSS